MKTIYIDADHKCHLSGGGTMTAVETDAFDGKCDAFIEGFCYEVRENGVAVYPWKSYAGLDAAQRSFEQEITAQYEQLINELYEEVR